MCVEITKKTLVKFNTALLQYSGPEVQSPFSFLVFRSCSFVPPILLLPSFTRPISRLLFLILYLPFTVSHSPFLVRHFSFSISRSLFFIRHFSFIHGGPEVQTPFSFLVFRWCSFVPLISCLSSLVRRFSFSISRSSFLVRHL